MMKKIIVLFLVISSVLLYNCSNNEVNNNASSIVKNDEIQNKNINYLTDYEPISESGNINVIIEIPAGTLEKWEINKKNGGIQLEYIDKKPRIIQYLPYPGNYGMIPQTLLPKELGGDGDPLDVLVLGEAEERGSIVECKIIGVLKMLDQGEQDDKLIAVKSGSPFYHLNSIKELKNEFNGIPTIISTWFANYKGRNKIEVIGFEESEVANNILQSAIESYEN